MNSTDYPRWVVIMDAGEAGDHTEFMAEGRTLLAALRELEIQLEEFTGEPESFEDDPLFDEVMSELFSNFFQLMEGIEVQRNDFSTPESNYTLKAQYFLVPELEE